MAEYLKEELFKLMNTTDAIYALLHSDAIDGIYYRNVENNVDEWTSGQFWGLLGYEAQDKSHRIEDKQALMHPEDLKITKDIHTRLLQGNDTVFNRTVRYQHRNGKIIWLRCRGLILKNENNKPYRMVGAYTNITDLKKTERHVLQLKKEYETVFNGTQDAMFLMDVEGYRKFRFIRNNQAHKDKTGVTHEMISGKTPYDLLGDTHSEPVIDHYQACVDAKQPISYEEILELPSGRRIWHTTLTPIFSQNQITNIVGSANDITERKTMEKELEKRANQDFLTGLLNRGSLTSKLYNFTSDDNRNFVLLFIDLDEFKYINDTYGHDTGDHILRTVSKRILNSIDENDIVARMGGDEFVIIKHGRYNSTTLQAHQATLQTAISAPIEYDDNTIRIHASIGSARYPDDGQTHDDLIRYADQSMYTMKKRNKTN